MAPKDAETPSATGTCGHTVWQYQHLAIGEHTIGNTVGPQFNRIAAFFGRTLQECGLCFLKEGLATAACCAHCGIPILVNSPVSVLGHPDPTTDILPFLAYATRVSMGPPNCFLFCMACSPGTITMAGYWTGTAIKQLKTSPLEALLSGKARAVMVTRDGDVTILK